MMRLRAIRVAEVGRFDAPVAVESLGDGLNVLSGPNELGKSTLLASLKVVLLAKYSSTAGDVRALIPNASGAPLIEADIEINGQLWRIRKQFTKGALAQLTDLKTGAKLRNADAQTKLEALIASPLEHKRFGFLWVDQGAALQDIDKNALGDGFAGLLEKELDAVILDGHARATHEAIKKALEPLRTAKTGNPKANGDWAKAIATLADAEKRLQSAEQRRAEQHAHLDEFAKLHTERAALMDRADVARRAETIARARTRLTDAQAAGHQRKLADGQLDVMRGKLQAAERAHKTLADTLASLRQLNDAEATGTRAAAAIEMRRTETTTAKAAAEKALADHAATIASLEKDLATARAHDAADQAAHLRDQLAERISNARAAAAERAAATEIATALSRITDTGVAALRHAASACASADAALAAVVPEVTIELAPSYAGAIRIDGRPISAHTVLHPDAPLVLDIVGIGRIIIAPNPQTVSAAQRAKRTALHQQADTQRIALNVTSLAEAEALLTQRQAADSKVREAHARFAGLAPAGLDHLLAQHAEAASGAATAAPAGQPVSVLAAALETARQTYAAATHARRTIEQSIAAIVADQARLEAAAAARAQQIAQLMTQLGDPTYHTALQSNAETALTEARQVFTDAKAAADAWAAHPDASRIDALSSDLVTHERAQADADQRGASLDRAVATLEGALRAAGDDDIEGSFARAQAAHQQALRRHAKIDTDVQALVLLDTAFTARAAAGQTELSQPIQARLAPYMHLVFPESALHFGHGLAPAQFARGTRAEVHEQLSRGTREQIAVLVRLGLCRLLADQGAGVPLLLDDALVYADDQRLMQMFDALALAAKTSQIVVLTCRAQAFAPLARRQGAVDAALRPWDPHTTA